MRQISGFRVGREPAAVATAPRWVVMAILVALALGGCATAGGAGASSTARAEPPAQPADTGPGMEIVCVGEPTCVSPELKRRVEGLQRDDFDGDTDHWIEQATWLLYEEIYDSAHFGVRVRAEFVHEQRVRLVVTRGPRFRLVAVSAVELVAPGKKRTAVGDPGALNGLAREGITLPSWANRTRLRKRIEAIQRRYQDAGYANADVIPVTSMHGNRVSIKVEIKAGVKARFRAIRLTGLKQLSEKDARVMLEVKAEQQYSLSALEASRNALLGHPCIEKVHASTQSDGEWVDVLFEIQEAATCPAPRTAYKKAPGAGTARGLLAPDARPTASTGR